MHTIVTSRKFIEAGNLEADLELLAKQAKIIYLEDVRESVGLVDKLFGLFARIFTGAALRSAGHVADPNSPAVILFTSGSEGVRRASCCHIATCTQIDSRPRRASPFTAQDIVFNALPMFHAFG